MNVLLRELGIESERIPLIIAAGINSHEQVRDDTHSIYCLPRCSAEVIVATLPALGRSRRHREIERLLSQSASRSSAPARQ